jgi:hypothetical protein
MIKPSNKNLLLETTVSSKLVVLYTQNLTLCMFLLHCCLVLQIHYQCKRLLLSSYEKCKIMHKHLSFYVVLILFLVLFPDHYLGLNGLNMREAGDATYTPSSSQPLNPNIPYSPDGMINTYYHNLINSIFQTEGHTIHFSTSQ